MFESPVDFPQKIGRPGLQGPAGANGAPGAAGANGAPGATGATGSLLMAQYTFTRAELQALDTVPITIVPAGGPNTVILPVVAVAEVNKTVASGGPNPTFRLQYTNAAGQIVISGITTSLTSGNNSGDVTPLLSFTPTAAGAPSTALPCVNAPLVATWSADGGGVFVATARLTVIYAVIPTMF